MASFWKRKPGSAAAASGGPSANSIDAPGVVMSANDISTRKSQLRSIPKNQPIELGTINYCNLTADGRHGDYDMALRAAAEADKPLFANFVEWSG